MKPLLLSYLFVAFTFIPINPDSGNGCRCRTCRLQLNCTAEEMENCESIPFCRNTTGRQFIKCIENEVYNSKDVILNHTYWYAVNVKQAYASHQIGFIVQSLEMESGVMTFHVPTTVDIALNPNLAYTISFTDPKLQFLSGSPAVFPRSDLSLNMRAGTFILYLQVWFMISFVCIFEIDIKI